MKQVAPGVYVHQYQSGNVGFVRTGAGVVCIDSPMLPSDIRDWQAKIASVTEEPTVALIQTDYDQVRVVGSRFSIWEPGIEPDSIRFRFSLMELVI